MKKDLLLFLFIASQIFSTTNVKFNSTFPSISGSIKFENLVDFSIDNMGDIYFLDGDLAKVFCFDKDGIIISNGENDSKVIQNIKSKEIDLLSLKNFKDSIDVTGNIKGKLQEIKKICDLGIPVQLINGQKPKLLIKALKNEKILSTLIK